MPSGPLDLARLKPGIRMVMLWLYLCYGYVMVIISNSGMICFKLTKEEREERNY